MKQLTALTVSIGGLALVATWVYLSAGTILIWAAFLAWACFYHCGADYEALKNTVVCNVFGCFMAWLAAVAILAIPFTGALGLPLWAAIVVGISVAIVVYAANLKAFAVIPATFYGYAATFAYLLQTPGKLALANLTSFSLSNAPIVCALSLIIGAGFGFASAKVGALLTARTVAKPA